MLWFVGTGISGYRGLSLAALEVLKNCDIVYVERYTSSLSDDDVHGLESVLGFQLKPVPRWFVEDGRQIVEASKSQDVALVTYGDPLIATTHTELRVRAARNSIKSWVLHSASGPYSTIGETGLHAYKFGKSVTMMSDSKSALSVHNTIFENLLGGAHTFILTEYSYNEEENREFYLSPKQVFGMLSQAESEQKYHVFSEDTFAVVASRIGKKDQEIVSGKVRSLLNIEFGLGPHSLIVTGPLHFTESEALSSLTRCLDPPEDNSSRIIRISAQMVNQYAPKTRRAVRRMHELAKDSPRGEHKRGGMIEVLDNAECYISDAERFLKQGKFELAVLSIGYAEGLVDALRFQNGINPWEQDK